MFFKEISEIASKKEENVILQKISLELLFLAIRSCTDLTTGFYYYYYLKC